MGSNESPYSKDSLDADGIRYNDSFSHGWFTLKISDISSSKCRQSKDTIQIPEVIQSVETLGFLGFTNKASYEIIDSFRISTTYREIPEGFLRCAKDYVHAHEDSATARKDAATTRHDWITALDGMGIKAALRDRILDNRFASLRLTESASFWVRDTITAKFGFLIELEERILNIRGLPRVDGADERRVLDTEIDLMKGGDAASLRAELSSTVGLPSRIPSNLPDFDRDQSWPEEFLVALSILKFSRCRANAETYADYMRVRVQEQGQDVVDVGILHLVLPKQLLVNQTLVKTERRRIWLEVFPEVKKLDGFFEVDLDDSEKINDWQMIEAGEEPRERMIERVRRQLQSFC